MMESYKPTDGGQSSSLSHGYSEQALVLTRENDDWIVKSMPELQETENIQQEISFNKESCFTTINDKICLLGGLSPVGSTVTADVVMFDVKTGEYSKCKDMLHARYCSVAVASDNLIVVRGGFGADKCLMKSAEIHDVRTNEWFDLPDVPEAVGTGFAVPIPCHGFIFAGGYGHLTGNYLVQSNKVYLLKGDVNGPAKQKWEWIELPSMGLTYHCSQMAYFEGSIYVTGGNEVKRLKFPADGSTNGQWNLITDTQGSPSNIRLFAFNNRLFIYDTEGHIYEYDKSRKFEGNAALNCLWKFVCQVQGTRYPFIVVRKIKG